MEIGKHLVLVGKSDSGKSSVLRAIHLVLGLPHPQLIPAIGPTDFSDPKQPLVVELDLVELSEDDLALFADEVKFDEHGTRLRLRLEADVDEEDGDARTVRRFFVDQADKKNLGRVHLEQVDWFRLPADRSVMRELGSSSKGLFRALLSRIELADDHAKIIETYETLHKVLEDADGLKKLRSGVADGINETVPRGMVGEDVKLTAVGDPERAPLGDVSMSIRNATGEFAPMAEHSEGLRSATLMALIRQSVGRMGITAIDEPELHLHPQAQVSLGERLAASDEQLIVATHSGHIAAAFLPGDTVCLSSTRSARKLPLGHDAESDLFFWRWWSSELVETLTCERLLFVEGTSDAIIFKSAAQALGYRVASRGLQVVELDGKATFRRLTHVLGAEGFGIPVTGMCDEDAQDRWAEVLGLETHELDANGIYVAKPDLETEVVHALGASRVVDLLLNAAGYSKKGLRNALKVTDLAAATDTEVTELWGRDRNKVPVAVAIARGLTKSDAMKLQFVVDLLSVDD